MQKVWTIGVGVITLSVAVALAQGDAAGKVKHEKKAEGAKVEKKAEGAKAEQKADKPKVELKEMTVEGMLTKVEGKGKDGAPVVSYKMATDAGVDVALPRVKAGEASAVNFENFAGSRVKIVGMGAEGESKGKKRIMLKSIKTIEKVAAAAAPAI